MEIAFSYVYKAVDFRISNSPSDQNIVHRTWEALYTSRARK